MFQNEGFDSDWNCEIKNLDASMQAIASILTQPGEKHRQPTPCEMASPIEEYWTYS